MGKLAALKAAVRGLGRKPDPEMSRTIDLATDEFKHNLRKAVENGKLQAESAAMMESKRIQDAVKAEVERNEPDLMKLVASSLKAIKKTTLEGIDAERNRVQESMQVQTREMSERLTQEVGIRTQELRSRFEAEAAAVEERCEQRLRAVEAAVIDACDLENAEKERRIVELREFLNGKVEEVRMAIEDEVSSAKAEIRRLVQRQAEGQSGSDYGFRWVVVEERNTGRQVQVLASRDGRQVHCGACGGSACRHAVKVAEALRSRSLSQTA